MATPQNFLNNVRQDKDVKVYLKGTNPGLDVLVDWSKFTIIIVNWDKGRVPVEVPLAVTNKKEYAGKRYVELYADSISGHSRLTR